MGVLNYVALGMAVLSLVFASLTARNYRRIAKMRKANSESLRLANLSISRSNEKLHKALADIKTANSTLETLK